MVVPVTPAHISFVPSLIFPSRYDAFHAHFSPLLAVVIATSATYVIDANASPRNPNVSIASKSSKFSSFDVVCLSHTISKSSSRIPMPLSVIWSNFFPPSLHRMDICVAEASKLFSINSFKAECGPWMTFSLFRIFSFSSSSSERERKKERERLSTRLRSVTTHSSTHQRFKSSSHHFSSIERERKRQERYKKERF